MKQLVEYTIKNLYNEFKPEDVCFVVAKSCSYISDLSYLTDDLNDALSFAKENDYNIFVYKKKFTKDCLDTYSIFRNTIENIQEAGFDIDYALCIKNCGKKAEKDFNELIEQWFFKYIDSNTWFADNLIGTLKVDESQEKEE